MPWYLLSLAFLKVTVVRWSEVRFLRLFMASPDKGMHRVFMSCLIPTQNLATSFRSDDLFAPFTYIWNFQGTQYIYRCFFRPYLATHEKVIDRSLLELRVMAGDSAVLMWQKAMSYGQIRFFEFLQYANSPSKSVACPDQVFYGLAKLLLREGNWFLNQFDRYITSCSVKFA